MGGGEAVGRKWDPALSNNKESQRSKRNGLGSVVRHESKKKEFPRKGKRSAFPIR